jgi:hypothetical protein
VRNWFQAFVLSFKRDLCRYTSEHQSVTASQISPSGLQLISKRLPDEERQLVDDLCIVDGKLLQVVWEDSKFLLRTMTFSRESSITEAEDVSYVVSPYLPRALRRVGGVVTPAGCQMSYADRTQLSSVDQLFLLQNNVMKSANPARGRARDVVQRPPRLRVRVERIHHSR